MLNAAGTYKVYMKLFASEFENVEVYEEIIIIKMISGPTGGSINIDQEYGSALAYNFSISAPNWTGEYHDNGFLKYQYFYQDETGEMMALTEQAYDLTEIRTLLPPTDLIQVRVTDVYNGTTTLEKRVFIRIDEELVDFDKFISQTN